MPINYAVNTQPCTSGCWSDLAQTLRQALGEWCGVQSERGKDDLLTRLLALNAQRAAEEAQGSIRWLRPEFQNPQNSLSKQELPAQVQQALDVDFVQDNQSQIDSASNATTATGAAQVWPAALPEQVRAVALVLASACGPLTLAALEAQFKGKGTWKKSLPTLLQTLEALGRVQRVEGGGETPWRS